MMLTDGSSGSPAGVTHLMDGDGTDAITLPPEISLSGAGFERVGHDLVVAGPDGAEVVVRDFFLNETPPDLFDAAGGYFAGAFAAKLAGSIAPAQWAQAGDVPALAPIGTVDSLQGTATSTRADGSVVTLAVGDPVFADDIVSTAADGAIGIVFVDGTVLSLGGSSSIVLDELVYEPGGASGALTFSVVEGVFVFVSGAVAKTGPDAMVIETPVASIGIRGTVFGVSYDAATGQLETSLMPETDPVTGERLVGEITVTVAAPDGTVLAVETINVVDARVSVANSVVSRMPVTAEDTANQFGPAATPTLGDTFVDPSYLTPGGERGQDRGDRGDGIELQADGVEAFTTEAGQIDPLELIANVEGAHPEVSPESPAILVASPLQVVEQVPLVMPLLPGEVPPAATTSSAIAIDSISVGGLFTGSSPPDVAGSDSSSSVTFVPSPAPSPDTMPVPVLPDEPTKPRVDLDLQFTINHRDTLQAHSEDFLSIFEHWGVDSSVWDALVVDAGETMGRVERTDAGITYRTDGAFDALPFGTIEKDVIVITTPESASDPFTAQITISIQGGLLDNFEQAMAPDAKWTSVGSSHAVSSFAFLRPAIKALEGEQMLRLDSRGATGPDLNETLEALGVARDNRVLIDSDGSRLDSVSALWQTIDVNAGDVISFQWAFDDQDIVSMLLGKNDFSAFIAGDQAFRILDDRGKFEFLLQSESRPQSLLAAVEGMARYTAPEPGPLLIGFAAFDDAAAPWSFRPGNSVLLVDNIRVNDSSAPNPPDQGYALISGDDSSPFQAWGQPVTAAAA